MGKRRAQQKATDRVSKSNGFVNKTSFVKAQKATLKNSNQVSNKLPPAEGREVSVVVDIIGHASPRWEYPKGSKKKELNLELSRQRAEGVQAIYNALLQRVEFENNGRSISYNVSRVDHDAKLLNGNLARGVGDTVTATESKKPTEDNLDSARRVDIKMAVTHTIRDNIPSTRVGIIPKECKSNRSKRWAIKLKLSGGGGHAGLGAAAAVATIKNLSTGQTADGVFAGGGIGVGLQTPGGSPNPGWEEFVTDREVTFDHFDNTMARFTSIGFGAFVGFSIAYISFPMIVEDPIYVGGWNVGAVGADGSSNVGVWTFTHKPPGKVCTPEQQVEIQTFTSSISKVTEEVTHTVRFDTGKANMSAGELQRLHLFVKKITERYIEI